MRLLRPETAGLRLSAAPGYGHGTLMRAFQRDSDPQPGWSAVWTIEDRHGYLAKGAEVRLRYTDLTRGAQAYTAESWTVPGFRSTEESWIPTLMVLRSGDARDIGRLLRNGKPVRVQPRMQRSGRP